MWQICGHIPQSLLLKTDVTCNATRLAVSFFIETFIHAKEKVRRVCGRFPERTYSLISVSFSLALAPTANHGALG